MKMSGGDVFSTSTFLPISSALGAGAIQNGELISAASIYSISEILSDALTVASYIPSDPGMVPACSANCRKVQVYGPLPPEAVNVNPTSMANVSSSPW